MHGVNHGIGESIIDGRILGSLMAFNIVSHVLMAVAWSGYIDTDFQCKYIEKIDKPVRMKCANTKVLYPAIRTLDPPMCVRSFSSVRPSVQPKNREKLISTKPQLLN